MMIRLKFLLFFGFFGFFVVTQSARTTRLPVKPTIAPSIARWPTTTPRPPYQGYLSFMLLCEPDPKCVSVNTKLDIIECLEKGMSLAAIYLYKQCTGQGTITCDDNDTSLTVKNCLKIQSGSFANLITDASRQCIREKVTLGNIDCYKINSRLRRAGQKFWMMSSGGTHFGPVMTPAPRRDDYATTRPVSIFEQAANLRTSTTTTTSTTSTSTTTSTTPPPVTIQPPVGRPESSPDYNARPESFNHKNNHQTNQGFYTPSMSSGQIQSPSASSIGNNGFASNHQANMNIPSNAPSGSMNHPSGQFLATRFLPGNSLSQGQQGSRPFIDSFPENTRLGHDRGVNNNDQRRPVGGINYSRRPTEDTRNRPASTSQPEISYEYIEYDDGQPEETGPSGSVTQATTNNPLTVFSNNRKNFDNQRKNHRLPNIRKQRTVPSSEDYFEIPFLHSSLGNSRIRGRFLPDASMSFTSTSRLPFENHGHSFRQSQFGRQMHRNNSLSSDWNDPSLSSSWSPRNRRMTAWKTITDDDSTLGIIPDAKMVSVLLECKMCFAFLR